MKIYCIYIVHSSQTLYNTNQSEGVQGNICMLHEKKKPSWFCGCKPSVCSIPNTAAVSFPGPGTKPDVDKASKKSLGTKKGQIPKTLKVLLGLERQKQQSCLRSGERIRAAAAC